MVIQKLFVFIAGLFAGTFVNICVYRIPRNEPARAVTLKCAGCGKSYKIYYLLPVFSFILFDGKCGYCKKRIPWNNPLVELLTGVAVLLLFYRYGWGIEFFAFVYLAVLLIIMACIDMKRSIIPNGIVIAGLIGGLAVFTYNIFYAFPYYGTGNWWTPLVGMLPGTTFLFMLFLAGLVLYKSEDAMGMGDVKIFAPVGMFLGWKMCGIALIISLVAGGIASTVMLLAHIKKRRDTIPFGPFIALGTYITIIAGWDILYWYIG